jgi:hypothetical protein
MMNLAVENPVRLVAIVGVVAALGVGIFVVKSAKGGGSDTASQSTLLHTSVGHRAKPKAHPKPTPTHRTTPKPVRVLSAATAGFPRSIRVALAKHPVVVISVVAPRGRVDDLAYREALAGAQASHAGFVRINAFRQAEIAPLEAKVDVHGNPALIVMKRPAEVSIQIDGFADRATVIQAVTDARSPAPAQ